MLIRSIILLTLSSVTFSALGQNTNATPDIAVNVDQGTTYDPFEGLNRKIYYFNNTLDGWILKPSAKAYKAITPDPIERSVGNFFSNLGEVGSIANSLFQGKGEKSLDHTGRFVINSTFGLFGLFDLATPMGITPIGNEDFGQTLGHWGLSPGPYLMVPFLGPANVRDGLSNLTINPIFGPVNYIEETSTRLTLSGADIINTRASLLEAEKLITGDRYSFIRDTYTQRREYLVQDGKVKDEFGGSLDDLDDLD